MRPMHTKDHLESKLKLLASDYPALSERIPQSFDSLVLFLKPFLVPLQSFDMCKNDCVAFRGQNKDATECPKCGSSRFAANGQAVRKFIYMSIEQRIRRMVETHGTRQLLDQHKFRKFEEQRDYQDSRAWKIELSG